MVSPDTEGARGPAARAPQDVKAGDTGALRLADIERSRNTVTDNQHSNAFYKKIEDIKVGDHVLAIN